jgi:hypothetical protein
MERGGIKQDSWMIAVIQQHSGKEIIATRIKINTHGRPEE